MSLYFGDRIFKGAPKLQQSHWDEPYSNLTGVLIRRKTRPWRKTASYELRREISKEANSTRT